MINRIQTYSGNQAPSKSDRGLHADFHAKISAGHSSAEDPFVLMLQIDGESFQVRHPKQLEAVRSYLANGEAETVAAALYKNIEPTPENLELVSKALNESPFDPELETEKEEPSFPKDAIERLKEALERSRASDRQAPAKVNVKEEKVPLPQAEIADLDSRLKTAVSASASEEGMPLSADARAEEAEERIQEQEIAEERLSVGRELREAATDMHGSGARQNDREQSALSADPEPLLESAVSDALFVTEFGQPSLYPSSSVPMSAITDLREAERSESDAPSAEAGSGRQVGQRRAEEGEAGNVLRPAESLGERTRAEELSGLRSERRIVSRRDDKNGADLREEKVDAVHHEDRLQESEGMGDAGSVRGEEKSDPFRSAGSEEWEVHLSGVLTQLLAGLENTSALLDVRRYEVTKLTDMTISATSEFREFQMDVERVLGKTSPASVKAAIDLLNRAVNKSSFALLADMRTEKTLLLALSKLDQAGEALRNRQFDLAERMVRQVAKEIGEIVFKPSVRRIQAIGEYDMRSNLRLLEKRSVTMGEKLSDALSLFSETRGRDVLELLRFTGINHEIEVLENTAAKSDIRNLKELFENTAYASDMSGGQMLNDSGDGRKREFYVFDLPMRIDEEIEGLKVFVNGRSENNAIDWKNAELYFGLKAKDEEKIGMKFSIRGGGLSVEVMADRAFDLSGLDEDVKALGYQMLSIRQLPYRKRERIPLHTGAAEGFEEVNRRSPEREERGRFDHKI